MRRWHTRDHYRQRVLQIADRISPLGLGTDIIVGFPGETERDHADTRDLVEELPFTYLHVFPFSVRESTAAAALPDRVPAATAAGRSRELREVGARKGIRYAAGRVGGDALLAVETDDIGLTGDYLRARLAAGCGRPGELLRARLVGTADDLRVAPGTTGRAALPVLEALPA
jgi:threonylcarbamoyladenosine tRNA methylthiotransferase MtaB